jgi:hypothetical protein
MSSLSRSGVSVSLRVTVATPVSVATLPIGSSGALCWSGAVAASPAGVGGVCACASRTRGAAPSIGRARPPSAGAGIAPAAETGLSARKPTSQIACKDRLDVTKGFPAAAGVRGFQSGVAECQMNGEVS